MAVGLTGTQKHNIGVLAAWVCGLTVVGLVVWLCVTMLPSTGPANADTPPPVPQQYAVQYSQINTSQDGQADHYCVRGKNGVMDGLFFEQQSPYTFTVVANDPLC